MPLTPTPHSDAVCAATPEDPSGFAAVHALAAWTRRMNQGAIPSTAVPTHVLIDRDLLTRALYFLDGLVYVSTLEGDESTDEHKNS